MFLPLPAGEGGRAERGRVGAAKRRSNLTPIQQVRPCRPPPPGGCATNLPGTGRETIEAYVSSTQAWIRLWAMAKGGGALMVGWSPASTARASARVSQATDSSSVWSGRA